LDQVFFVSSFYKAFNPLSSCDLWISSSYRRLASSLWSE